MINIKFYVRYIIEANFKKLIVLLLIVFRPAIIFYDIPEMDHGDHMHHDHMHHDMNAATPPVAMHHEHHATTMNPGGGGHGDHGTSGGHMMNMAVRDTIH